LSEDIVVVDGYQFGEDFWQRLLAARPWRTVCIDDLRDIRYVSDLLICCNEGVSAGQFQLAQGTRLLLGGRYMLLRQEVRRAARMTQRPTPRRAVMLAAGGTRQEQWVTRMLRLLALIEPHAKLWVLSGRRLPAGKVARRAGLGPGRVRFLSGLEPTGMLRLYRRARYLVAPASTMMLEAFAAGCPLISGWLAENQRNSLTFYERHGLIVNVGDLRALNRGLLERARDHARREAGRMIRRQRAYIAASQAGIKEIVRAVLTSDNVA
jgi:spore coat polysaccharide biosynthesis predicted glycosyltransferase SpsG